jgi:asparagine synthase (glutamine-hydrolysing)
VSGFVAILNRDGSPVDRTLLERMTQSLAPRGPDAQHVCVHGGVGFGHALLRTTYEAHGEYQPFALEGTGTIAADCRIDGRDELIRKLEERGRRVAPDSPDPELILHAYEVWNTACVDRLLGDFSFAIWDERRQTLFCVRDQIGIKPFFYAQTSSALAVSNDLACLRPLVPGDLDELAIADFLLHDQALDLDRTSFKAIRRLPPAHVLIVSSGQIAVRRYWEWPLEEEITYRRRTEYTDHFLELLETATRDRLRTDRVGIFMSGGLDSTAIASTAHRILSASTPAFDLRAHAIVFDRVVDDRERRFSQLAADAIGIPVQHYPFDDYGFPPPEPEPDGYPPEPRGLFDRSRAIAVHRTPAMMSRVLLRGDGADALVYATASALERLLRERGTGRALGEFAWLAWRRRQVPRLGIRTVVRRALGRTPQAHKEPYPNWLEPTLERRHQLRARWEANRAVEYSRPGFELSHAYWPTFFECVDPGTMHLAAEARYPFLDLRLVRFLLRLPQIPWMIEKSVLRIAMSGRLPRAILRRPKAPVAGNPWVQLLPPVETSWWEPYMVPAPAFEDFVNVRAANDSLRYVLEATQHRNHHADIDDLRVQLRPISLNLWLRQIADPSRRSLITSVEEAL